MNIFLSLFIILIGGILGGFVFEKIRLPKLVWYIILGILIGPSLLNIVDDTLLSQLNAFGKTRGQIAHKTTKIIRDYKNEQEVVEALLINLLDLDKKFETLK